MAVLGVYTLLFSQLVICFAMRSIEQALYQAFSIANYRSYQRSLGVEPNSFYEIQHSLDALSPFESPRRIYSSLSNDANDTDCKKNFVSIAQGLLANASWAYSWLDATGKIPPGIYGGALYWTGSFDVCKRSVAFDHYTNNIFRGRYCSLAIPTNYSSTMGITLNYGICVPESCQKEELISLIESNHLIIEPIANLSICHRDANELPKDVWFYCALTLIIFVLLLVITGSLTEWILYNKWWWNNSYRLTEQECFAVLHDSVEQMEDDQTKLSVRIDASNDLAIQNNIQHEVPVQRKMSYLQYRDMTLDSHPFLAFLCAYSAPYNAWKICSAHSAHVVIGEDGVKREHPLTCLDGIRLITMIWIIFGHLLLFSMYSANNLLFLVDKIVHSTDFMFIVNGTLSVDTFFFMSGLLTTYLTLNRYRHLSGIRSRAKFWGLFVMHRFIRLTPAYLFVLVIYVGLFIHLQDGPLFPQDSQLLDFGFCRRNWYLIYINNLIKPQEMCMAWAWYLANDMQFSIVLAPIFISLIASHYILGILFALFLVVSAAGNTISLVLKNNYSLLPAAPDWFSVVYVRPYTRWGTYAIGMFLGWILVDKPRLPFRRNLTNRILIGVAGVLLASTFSLLPIYGPYGVISGKLPPMTQLQVACYHGLSRLSFVLGIAIVVFLCATGWFKPIRSLLAWSGFRIGARLTYGAYLMHPIVLFYVYLGAKAPHIVDNTWMVAELMAAVVLSYLASFVLSLMTESPTLALERYLRRWTATRF